MGKNNDSVDSTLDQLLDALRESDRTHLIVAGISAALVVVGVFLGRLFC